MPAATKAQAVSFTHATAKMVKPGPATFPSSPTIARAPIQVAVPRTEWRGWLGAHKVLTAVLGLLVLGAGVSVALVSIGQPFVATPTAGTSPVVFASGDDSASLLALGLSSTPAIVSGGGSASVTLYGIPGASALSLGEILELTNTDTADNAAFTVTLSVAGSPAASLTAFTLTFSDDVSGTPTTRTWNLLTTPTLTTYTMSDAEVWEFTVSSLTMTSAATGSLGAMTITATITQV